MNIILIEQLRPRPPVYPISLAGIVTGEGVPKEVPLGGPSVASTADGLNPEMTGTMLRVCMVCKVGMGTKPCLPRFHNTVSHSICDECNDKEPA